MKQQMVYIVGLFFVFSFAYGSHGKVLLKENIYDEYPIDMVQGSYMELPCPKSLLLYAGRFSFATFTGTLCIADVTRFLPF